MKKTTSYKTKNGFAPIELIIIIGISAVIAAIFIFTINAPVIIPKTKPINVNVEAPKISVSLPIIRINGRVQSTFADNE